ncbi:MAG: amino acid adenylation domain-containing protein, partial [Clostridia bacterium]|nr:amino acid adenylation domain-containing protein [Clostridia bacterium]
MTVYSLYVSRTCNLDDFVMGTPILNRTNFDQKHTIGMFISVAPLRISINNNASFIDFAKKISTDTMALLRHQKYSYQSILEDIRKRDSSIPNLYNIILSYQITKTVEEGSGVNYFTDWSFNGNSSDELQIHLFDLNDEDSMTVAYDYKSSKFDEQEIANLHDRILVMIRQIIANENIALKEIEIVTPKEKKQILYDFNSTSVDYPCDKTIVDLFEEQVEKTPDNIAIVFEDKKLTYQELNERANQLARYLKKLDVKTGDIISVLFDRSLEMILSILGILKTGAAYLPLDPNYPKERIDYILSDCKSKYILTNVASAYKQYDNVIPYSTDLCNSEDVTNLKITISPSSLSYLIYTSGSTGTPKGVMLKHLSLSNLIYYCNDNIEYLKKPEYISIVSITTVSFDIFIFETLISLQKGLKVVIANSNQQVLPVELNKLIEKEDIKAIQTTPSRMQTFYNNIDVLTSFKMLKYITLAGEQLPVELSQKLHSISGATIYNGYGPSETTVFATLTDVTDKTNQMTIGKPLYNNHIYILDSNKNLCPIGVSGEIYISGDNVGLGYINNANLTKQSFSNDPFFTDMIMYRSGDLGYFLENGEIICSGRIDHQVKIRGLRVELEEIECVIKNNSNIDNCVIDKVLNTSNNECLCAYFTQSGPVDIDVLKNKLYQKLPNYMVPEVFVKLDNLPYTPNGKVDRKKLPKPIFSSNKNIVTARNDLDKLIINILSQLLHIDKISLLDSFYSLGGDSLTAISLSTKIFAELKISISIQDIFSHPIIKDLSDYISTLSKNSGKATIRKIEEKAFYPASS